MTTVPSLPTYYVGQKLTATNLNDIAEAIHFGQWAYVARVKRSAALSVSSATTYTAVEFDLEDYDAQTWHSTVTNSHAIIPKIAGFYRVDANAGWAGASGGYRTLQLLWSNTTAIAYDQVKPAGTEPLYQSVSAFWYANGTSDYFSCDVRQNSGGAVDLDNCWLSVQWIGK